MRTWTTVCCPHCKQVVERQYEVGTSMHINIGMPVDVCPYCKKPFKRTSINEWLFLSQKERDEYLKFGESGSNRFGMWAMIICTSIITIVAIACSANDNHYIWILAGIFILATLLIFVLPHILKSNGNKAKKYNQIIFESIDRCCDINYLTVLKAAGFVLVPLNHNEIQNNPQIK